MIIFYTADINRVYAAVILVYSHCRAAVLRAAAARAARETFLMASTPGET